MALVSMKDMLIQAKEKGYAVGQFNINNLEFTQAILLAAKEENSPVILGVSEGAARYMGGFKLIVSMVKELIEEYDVTVPVAIHLDHGPSLEKCVQAIHAGFTSVMIDGSHYPLEENIEITKRVVEMPMRLVYLLKRNLVESVDKKMILVLMQQMHFMRSLQNVTNWFVKQA